MLSDGLHHGPGQMFCIEVAGVTPKSSELQVWGSGDVFHEKNFSCISFSSQHKSTSLCMLLNAD